MDYSYYLISKRYLANFWWILCLDFEKWYAPDFFRDGVRFHRQIRFFSEATFWS